jgi:hypothetical protein
MTRHQIRALHKWVGVVCCAFTLVVSVTAVALNHPEAWKPLFSHAQGPFSPAQAAVMVSDPFAPQHLLASSGKALFQSRDGGQTWAELKLYVPADKVTTLAFSPTSRDRFWIGLKEVGIFTSDDGGDVWEEVTGLPFDPVAGEYIEQLSITTHNQLVIKTRYGLYTQQGDGWRSHRFPEINAAGLNTAQDWIWRLHTGRGLGAWGIPLYDAIAVSLIFLALSGLWLSFRPRRKSLPRKGVSSQPQQVLQ